MGDEKTRPPGFRRGKHPFNFPVLRWVNIFEIEGDQLYLRFGRSTGDEVKGIEVQKQNRKDVKFTKLIHVLMTYDKKLGLQSRSNGF